MTWNFLTRWLGFETCTEAKKAARAGRRLRSRTRLGLEQLEERQMLTVVQFSPGNYRVNEGNTKLAVGVKLDAPLAQTVTVNYTTRDGTAKAGQDYTAGSGVLEFAPGEVARMIVLSVNDDLLHEAEENLVLSLTDPSNNATLGTSDVTVTIGEGVPPTVIPTLFATGVDDQGSLLPGNGQDPHYTLVAPTDPAYQGPAVVPPAEDPPPPGAWFSSGTRSQWIAPHVNPFVPSGAYVYETTFDLTGYDLGNVLIQGEWATDDNGEIFLNGVSTGITSGVSLYAFNSFTLNSGFQEGTNTLQFHVTNGPDASGLRVQFGGTGTVDPVPTVSFSMAGYEYGEDAETATVRVDLNAPSGQTVSINFATDDGTATAGDDYQAASGTLVFNPGDTFRTFSVPIVHDAEPEVNETVNLTLSGPVNATLGLHATATLTILDVPPVNHAPELDNSGDMNVGTIDEDQFDNNGTLVTDLLASAGGDRITDVDSGALEGIAVIGVDDADGDWQFSTDGETWTSFGTPSSSEARLLAADDNTRVRFVPDPDFNGTVEAGLTFRAWDQTTGSNSDTADATEVGGSTAFSTATETARIIVNPVNDAPEIEDQDFSVDEGSPAETVVGTVFATALDADQTLSYEITDGNAGGAFAIDPETGEITVAAGAALDHETTPTFALTVRVSDEADSAVSASATVTIEVNNINEAPVNTVPDSQSVNEDESLALSTLSVEDVDAGDSFIETVLSVSHGTLSVDLSGEAIVTGDGTDQVTLAGFVSDINLALGGVTYTPDANYHGPDTLTVHTDDSGASGYGGPLTDEDTVEIDVDPVNDAPIAEGDTYTTNRLDPVTENVLLNDTDADGDDLVVTAINGTGSVGTPITLGFGGQVTVSADGSFTYTPDPTRPENLFTETFTYTISDGSDTATAAVTFTVADGQWANSLLGPIAAEWRSEGLYDWSAVQALGTPNTFRYGDIGTAWSTLEPDDGLQSLTVGFPTPAFATGLLVRENFGNGFVTRIDLIGEDDVPRIVWTGYDDSQPGRVVDFAVTFPQTDYLVKGARIYVDTDHISNVWEEIDAVRLIGSAAVVPPTEVPLVQDDAATVVGGAVVSIPVLSNDGRVPGVPLRRIDVAKPFDGTVTVHVNGTPSDLTDDYVTYLPDHGFSGIDAFTYSLTDIYGNSESALVTITVLPGPNPGDFLVADDGSSLADHEVSTSADGTSTVATSDGWSQLTSPFYARSRVEAKFRAWVLAPAGATDATPVGDTVERDFGVDASLSWGQFFTRLEYQDFVQQRTEAAAGLDPVILARLHEDWMRATQQPGHTEAAPVEEDVAARWQRVPGFTWVEPETGWQELYTLQEFRRFRNLRTAPIPRLDLGQAEWTRLATEGPPIATIRYLTERRIGGTLAREVLTAQLRDRLLPRLRYASSDEVAGYVRWLGAADRLTLRYALDLEMARLSEIVTSPGGVSVENRIDATAALLLYQQVYSEMHHNGDQSAYGVHARTVTGVVEVVDDVQRGLATDASYSTYLATENRGSFKQRVAFLADTDYETFRAREVAVIDAKYASALQDPSSILATLARRNHAAEIFSLPTAERYYLTRNLLIQVVQKAEVTGGRVDTALQPLFGQWYEPPQFKHIYRPAEYDDSGTRYRPARLIRPAYSETRLIAPGVPNPFAQTSQFVNDRYLRAADLNQPMSLVEYYSLDRYSQANMGLYFLPSWRQATEAQKNAFADYLRPLDREALLQSLGLAAQSFRADGDFQTADAARDMAVFILNRFNAQMSAMRADAALAAAFEAASTAEAALHGIPAEHRDAYDRLAPSVQRLASSRATQAVIQWRLQNPVVIKYNPVFGLEFFDRTVLNLAEFLSPVYRTGERLIGLGQGLWTGDFTRTDQFSDLDAIRSVMAGDFTAQLGPRTLGYGVGEIVWDGGLTVLTVLPVGSGSRVAISGGRFLPAGGAFARAQLASASRHLKILLPSVISSSMAMAAVEVAPIHQDLKGPLRFLAGIGTAFGSAALLSSRIRRIETILPTKVQELTRASAQLDEVVKNIGQLQAAGQAIPAKLVQQQTALTRRIQQLTDEVNLLRALGGANLTQAEQAYEAAYRQVAELEAKAGAAGIAPSVRAARRSSAELQSAREALANAHRDLGRVYDQIHELAFALGASNLRSIPRAAIGAAHTSSPDYSRLMVQALQDYARQHPGLGAAAPPHWTVSGLPARLQRLREMGTPEALAERALLQRGLLDPSVPSLVLPSRDGILRLLDLQNTPISRWVATEIRANRLTLEFVEELTTVNPQGVSVPITGLHLGEGRVQIATTYRGRVRDLFDATETAMHEARHHLERTVMGRPVYTQWEEFRAIRWGWDGLNFADPLTRARFGSPLSNDLAWIQIRNPQYNYSTLPLGDSTISLAPPP